MRKISIYICSIFMIVLAIIAVIKGLNRECVLLCGLATSANCLQDITDRHIKTGALWYLLVICAAAAGFLIYPLIPTIVSCIVLVSLNLYSHVKENKKEI